MLASVWLFGECPRAGLFLAVGLVVIRLLTAEDYGLLAMAALPVGFLMLVADLGVSAVVVQAPTLSQRQLRALFGVCLLA